MTPDTAAPLTKTIKITVADFERLGEIAEPFEPPGRTLTRALDRAARADELETILRKIQIEVEPAEYECGIRNFYLVPCRIIDEEIEEVLGDAAEMAGGEVDDK